MTRDEMQAHLRKVETMNKLLAGLRASVGPKMFDWMMQKNQRYVYPTQVPEGLGEAAQVVTSMNHYARDMRDTISMERKEMKPISPPTFKQKLELQTRNVFRHVTDIMFKKASPAHKIVSRRVLAETVGHKQSTSNVFRVPLDYGYRIKQIGHGVVTYGGKPHMIIDAIEIKSEALRNNGYALYRGIVARNTANGVWYEEARFAKHLETQVLAAGRTAKQAIQLADRQAIKVMMEKL